jgi:hypothetical protein
MGRTDFAFCLRDPLPIGLQLPRTDFIPADQAAVPDFIVSRQATVKGFIVELKPLLSLAFAHISAGAHLVGPYPEARQRIWTERGADCDVAGITAARDQHPADSRRVVAGVERVPPAFEEGLEPGGEVHRPSGGTPMSPR